MFRQVKVGLASLLVLLLVACQSVESGADNVQDVLAQSPLISGLNLTLGEAERNMTLINAERNVAQLDVVGWDYIDDRHLVIDTGIDEFFLVIFQVPCTQAEPAIDIRFQPRDTMLNPGINAILMSPEGRTSACRIETMYHLVPADSGSN